MKTGIDDINLYVPPFVLTTEKLKVSRGISDKLVKEIGFTSRSIVPNYEDVVTLAVNAALPIVKGHENEFDLLIVATESSFDFGKPISTYVHRYLNLPAECSNFEIKHACYSGTAALKMASAWVKQHDSDKKALVIMSDLARNHLDLDAQMTPGNAAIAISVSKNPRVLELNLISGCATNEVYDVARPTNIIEYGDPVLSLGSFLDLAEMSWNNFNEKHNIKDIRKHFAYMLFHVPLLSLVKKTHAVIMEQAIDLDREEIEKDFDARVMPTLRLNMLTGNVFSASVYVSLISLILDLKDIPQFPIALFSYGSGACAEFFEAWIQPGAREIVRAKKIDQMFAEREDIDVKEYDEFVAEQSAITTSNNYEPTYDSMYQKHYTGKKLLVLDKIENYHRLYKFS